MGGIENLVKLPKGTRCTPIPWRAAAEPPKKRPKRGPGRPRKVREPEPEVVILDSDSDKENNSRIFAAYMLLWPQ